MSKTDAYPELLGMNVSTAHARLRKQMLYRMAVQLKLHQCYRCSEWIKSADELSIDHKKPWRHVSADLFWDLDNVAFSHRRCNKVDRPTRRECPEGHSVCGKCNKVLPVNQFSVSNRRWNGLSNSCKECDKTKSRNYDRNTPRFPCPECSCQMRKKCQNCGYELAMKEYMALRRSEGVTY